MVPISRALDPAPTAQPTWVCAEYGRGAALAVVMAPVMPWWDGGDFFRPLTQRLVELGYRVLIFDTLAVETSVVCSLADFTAAWLARLQGLGPVQLLAGSALGGAVVQGLLGCAWARTLPAALLVSAPTQADERLNQRLGAMAELARQGQLEIALQHLERWVAPEGSTAPLAGLQRIDPSTRHSACRRLARGFELLHDADLLAAVGTFPGKLLSVYGEHSQLVNAAHVTFPRSVEHLALSVPGSGMRPHIEQPERVWAGVQAHLPLAQQVAQ